MRVTSRFGGCFSFGVGRHSLSDIRRPGIGRAHPCGSFDLWTFSVMTPLSIGS